MGGDAAAGDEVDRHPWDRIPDESGPAYEAFRSYLELGPGRTIADAYRQSKGRPEAGQPPGVWNGWVKAHGWAARARAWDDRQAAIYRRAVERTVAARAEDWARRRDEYLEGSWSLGRQLMRQAGTLAMLPVVRQAVRDEGRTVVIEPVDPADLRAAALIARDGAALARSAVEEALGLAPKAEGPGMEPDDERRRAMMDRASRELDAWRAEQLAKIRAISTTPPT